MANGIPSTKVPSMDVKGSRIISRRVLLGLLGAAFLTLLGANAWIYFTHTPMHQPSSSFQGTELGATPAPTFQLVDQNGTPIALQQLQGHPVVLTFLYTTCPGPCPLTAEKMHTAVQMLGAQARQVTFLAVSVNPTGDTPSLAKTFVATHRLTGILHFLLGKQSELEPIWKSYAVSSQAAQGGQMIHTVGAYIIDAQGRERVYLDAGFTPGMLATDLHMLLKNS
jgi:protein SCO1